MLMGPRSGKTTLAGPLFWMRFSTFQFPNGKRSRLFNAACSSHPCRSHSSRLWKEALTPGQTAKALRTWSLRRLLSASARL